MISEPVSCAEVWDKAGWQGGEIKFMTYIPQIFTTRYLSFLLLKELCLKALEQYLFSFSPL